MNSRRYKSKYRKLVYTQIPKKLITPNPPINAKSLCVGLPGTAWSSSRTMTSTTATYKNVPDASAVHTPATTVSYAGLGICCTS